MVTGNNTLEKNIKESSPVLTSGNIISLAPYYDIVVSSNDPEGHDGRNVATGRSPMPDRSKVMTYAKRDSLLLEVGHWACLLS
jgi:hypothetical protein